MRFASERLTLKKKQFEGDEFMIPSVEECFRLMDRYHMLENIRAHSIVVADVARVIAMDLKKAGWSVSLPRVTAAALMHDIGKTASLRTGEDHAELGRQICLSNDLVEIADIVAEHVVLRNPSREGVLAEKEIVYYADKRVNHDRIVNLDERLAYIILRYGRSEEILCRRIRRNFEICREIEQKLFNGLDFSPECLTMVVESRQPVSSKV